MIKISPFSPLFFYPSTDEYGVDSRYIQVFAPADNIVIQVLADEGESVTGKLNNVAKGTSSDLSFTEYTMSSGLLVYTAIITNESEGYYSVSINGNESNIFHITGYEGELSATSLISYTSNTNKHRKDVVFVTDTQYEFQFRVPGGFKDGDWAFEVNNEQFDAGDGNIIELYAIESTQKTFTMGNAMGCPIWFGEHLNRLLCATHVHINGVRYIRKGNSAPEVTQEIPNLKSYIFRVQLQGMIDNIDIELPSSDDDSESEGGGAGYVYLIKVGDETRPTDSNTFSALRMLMEVQKVVDEKIDDIKDQFLRKDQDDRTPHNLGVGGNLEVDGDASTGGNQTVGNNLEVGGTATIGSDTTIGGQTTMQKKATAKKGLQIGESFIPGILTGSGGFFDEYANGEIESLIIRRFLEVPELRFNRIEIKLGDKWNAPGAGIFESVVPDTDNSMTGTGYLKLEEGEYGAIAVGDICMGIFHSEVASENATADSDDSRGNFQFAGFYTCYFTITEITGRDNKQFRYQLRPVSDRWELTYHPSAQMTFVSYGSFSRTDRQTSVYTTRTYTRLLKNQNTWEISAANIAMQYGNMENMSIHGLDMTGYSMYLNNIYMTGIVRQVRPDGTPVMVVNDRGEYQSGTTYAYYDRVSYQGSLWLVVNESGTNTIPSKGDASWLLQVEAGVGINSAGQWITANTPYKANTIVTFADSVWISNKETSEAPFPIYTDNQGNRLTYNDGGYILVSPLIQSADWDLLLSAPDITKGEDGKSIEVRYSADKTNWHSEFQTNDLYMQQRIGDGVWSNAMRIVGETGADGTDGVYSEFQFAKNTSMTTAPTTGWQDGPPSIGNGEYLWMRQRVVNPNEGTTSSWQTVRIKGDTGDDGEGFTNMGQWVTGMTVPKMGVVTMGGSVYVAKVATTNPPLWCYTDNQGNRLLFNDGGYILTGEVNTAEYDLWVEKPEDGKDGKDGINGTNGKDGKDGKDGEDGQQGIQGCIVRDSEWAVGVNYRNDEALTSGTRWLDVALIRDDSAATGWRAYKCKVTHTSTTANAPGNTTYWEEFSANFTAIFTSLIIAKNAKITFLQGNQLLIQEDNGTITAGLSGSNEGNAYRFWAGASTPDNAPYKVDKYGAVEASKGTIGGMELDNESLTGDGSTFLSPATIKHSLNVGKKGLYQENSGSVRSHVNIGYVNKYNSVSNFAAAEIVVESTADSGYQKLVNPTAMRIANKGSGRALEVDGATEFKNADFVFDEASLRNLKIALGLI